MIKTLTACYLALSLALMPVVSVFADTSSSCQPGGNSPGDLPSDSKAQQQPCPHMMSQPSSPSGDCCNPDTSDQQHSPQCQHDCSHGAFSMTLPEPVLNLAAYTASLIPFAQQSLALNPLTPPYKPPRA
jgi:hypothetical protein